MRLMWIYEREEERKKWQQTNKQKKKKDKGKEKREAKKEKNEENSIYVVYIILGMIGMNFKGGKANLKEVFPDPANGRFRRRKEKDRGMSPR